MKVAIHIIVALQLLALVFLFYDTATSTMDAAGRGMAEGFLTLYALALVATGGPAVILALMGKWLPFALCLALLLPVLLLFLFAGG